MAQPTHAHALRVVSSDERIADDVPDVAPELLVKRLERQLKAQTSISETLTWAWEDVDEVREHYAFLCARQDREEARREEERREVERALSPDGRARRRHLHLVR